MSKGAIKSRFDGLVRGASSLCGAKEAPEEAEEAREVVKAAPPRRDVYMAEGPITFSINGQPITRKTES